MSYADHARNIQNAINELKATRNQQSEVIVLNHIALLKSRMINKGERSDGSISHYSPKEFPYYIFQHQIKNYKKNATPREGHYAAFNPKEKTAELYKKTGYMAAYWEWREVTNRVTEFKNYSFTNQMWHGIKPINVGNDEVSTAFVVWADDNEVIKKLNANIARDGNILAFSQDEITLLDKLNRERVFKVLAKHKVI